MVENVIRLQIQRAASLLEKYKQWNSYVKSYNLDDNTAVCCELIEMNALMQHELFKILRALVCRGGLVLENECCLKNAYSAPNILSDLRDDSRTRSRRLLPNNEPPDYIQSVNHVPSQSYPLDERNFANKGKSVPSSQFEAELLERLIQSQIQCDRLASKLRSKQNHEPENCMSIRPQSLINVNSRLNRSENDLTNQSCSYGPRVYNETNYEGVGGNFQSQPCSQDHYQLLSQQSRVDDSDLFNDVTNPKEIVLESDFNKIGSNHPATQLQSWLSPLVARYNDLFTNVRVKTMEQLQSYGQTDYERSQRLIFYAVQCGFSVTRQILRRLHSFSTQQQQQQPMNSMGDNIQLSENPLRSDQLDNMVTAALHRLRRHPPPDCACRNLGTGSASYARAAVAFRKPVTNQEINSLRQFMREICCLAWYLLKEKFVPNGPTNDSPGYSRSWHVDVDRAAKPGDNYDDTCYRRSYDSEPSSGQVHHYVWPCLILFSRSLDSNPVPTMQLSSPCGIRSTGKPDIRACILVKGEACTRNPKHLATQRDKAAALLNHEYFQPGQNFAVKSPLYNTQSGIGSMRTRSTSSRRI